MRRNYFGIKTKILSFLWSKLLFCAQTNTYRILKKRKYNQYLFLTNCHSNSMATVSNMQERRELLQLLRKLLNNKLQTIDLIVKTTAKGLRVRMNAFTKPLG